MATIYHSLGLKLPERLVGEIKVILGLLTRRIGVAIHHGGNDIVMLAADQLDESRSGVELVQIGTDSVLEHVLHGAHEMDQHQVVGALDD